MKNNIICDNRTTIDVRSARLTKKSTENATIDCIACIREKQHNVSFVS